MTVPAVRPVVDLAEWTDERLAGVALTAADLRLCERLKRRREDTQVVVYPDQDGVVVKARGAVGVVRFDAFDVHIHPKFPGDAIVLFRLLAYTAGWPRSPNSARGSRRRFATDCRTREPSK